MTAPPPDRKPVVAIETVRLTAADGYPLSAMRYAFMAGQRNAPQRRVSFSWVSISFGEAMPVCRGRSGNGTPAPRVGHPALSPGESGRGRLTRPA